MKRPRLIDLATLEETQTGRTLDAAAWEKAQAERLTLELQSEGIASRLERCGVRVREGKITMIGLLTESYAEKTAFRNCNIIPTCQSRNTHDMMKAVQYWMDTTSAKKTRMWVLSKGWVPLYEYSKHHKEFTRTISKLNSNPILKRYGVEFVYYAVENTIKLKEHGPGTKVPMLNLHAHVLLKANQFAGKVGWQMMLDEVRRYVPKGYLHDSPIKKAAEVVKYVFKPTEFDRLNDDQFASLFNQTLGLRFHTCLGELAEFRRGLKADGLKLKRIEGEAQGEWRLVKGRKRDDDKDKPPAPDMPCNMVVGITSPSPTFSEVYEPCLLVKDFNGSLSQLLAENPWIEQRMAALRRTADRQKARPSIKDTTTITVQDQWLDETVNWQPPPEFGDSASLDWLPS